MPRRVPHLRRIAVALLLGTATTLTLSFLPMPLSGKAWYGPPASTTLGVWQADDQKLWQLSRGDNAWHSVVTYWFMQVSGYGLSIPAEDYEAQKYDYRQLPRHLRPNNLTDLYMNAWYHETGWPFKALACSVHWKDQIANSDILYTVRGGLQLPRDAEFNPRPIPLTPLWPGLIANLAIYTIAWFALLTGVSTLLERRRARRGNCPHCNYSRAGLTPTTPCPECGHIPPPN